MRYRIAHDGLLSTHFTCTRHETTPLKGITLDIGKPTVYRLFGALQLGMQGFNHA
jgi:hypothetical protein